MRLKNLDVLRAVAVLLVLGRHVNVVAPMPADVPGPVALAIRAWVKVGWTGVDLFFVLSGFLVSGLLFAEYRKNGELRIGRFLIRRGFKIYPPFWVLMAVTLAAYW